MCDNIEVEQLIQAVTAGPKYRQISPELVRNVGSRELAKRGSLQDAIKATKAKLHQVAGAYLVGNVRYDSWLMQLRAAYSSGDMDAIKSASMQVMWHQSSTRERIPILDVLFAATLGGLQPIQRIIDVASGLNPLALPWMPLEASAEYFAYDVFANMATFLTGFFAIPEVASRVRGVAEVRDVITSPPSQAADVALLLKAIPCLEQVDKDAGRQLLNSLSASARHILVSFPVQSLGGRKKGMDAHYSARISELCPKAEWSIKRFDFASELAFLITKR